MDKTAKERMQRYREKKRNETVTLLDSVTRGSVTVDTNKAAKLLLICNALDKDVRGLDGNKTNLLSMVRYGIFGPTMDRVQAILSN